MKRNVYITPVTRQVILPAKLMVVGGSNGNTTFAVGRGSGGGETPDEDPNASRRGRYDYWDE